jgi:plasmid stabilization system protein ParE
MRWPTPRPLPIRTGNHIIFYRIEPSHIEIARVLHGARDIEALLHEQDWLG